MRVMKRSRDRERMKRDLMLIVRSELTQVRSVSFCKQVHTEYESWFKDSHQKTRSVRTEV